MDSDIRKPIGRTVIRAHQGDGHGDVLYLDFEDGTQLVVWAFAEPERLQVVYWDPPTGQIIDDRRTADCRRYTAEVFRRLARGATPSKPDTPFVTRHRATHGPE